MHYVSLRKVWKKVIKNKEVEGKKKKRRKRWWYGQGQGTEARLLNSSVLFLSLTFSWCPTSLLYTPSCSYSPMLLSRPSRWGSQSRTEPSKAKSSLGSKEHFWISWQRRLRQSHRANLWLVTWVSLWQEAKGHSEVPMSLLNLCWHGLFPGP